MYENSLDAVIAHYGGIKRLATAMRVHRAAITNWKRRGVPSAVAVAIERDSNGRFRAVDLCPPKSHQVVSAANRPEPASEPA